AYLKEYKHSLYLELVFAGKWNEYLHNVDEECYQMMELLIKQIKEKQGVTEPIKAENQMLCVGMVNNIRHSAEEVVLAEMIYI
ncbi:MAG: TnpV protein, partial [Anaerovoracaceae bacterium]